MKRVMKRQSHRAMTLLEVLLVIAILGVIAAMVFPKLVGRQKTANIDATKLSISGLTHALKLYAVDHEGEYPSTAEGIKALFEAPAGDTYWQGPYLEVPARDAWGNRFEYRYPGTLSIGSFDLVSPGPDGTPNTPDDITNKIDESMY